MAGRIWKPLAPGTDHLVVVDDATLEELELIPLVGYENALEAALRSEVVVITHPLQELEETIGGVYLLKCQYPTVQSFNQPFLRCLKTVTVMSMR